MFFNPKKSGFGRFFCFFYLYNIVTFVDFVYLRVDYLDFYRSRYQEQTIYSVINPVKKRL